MKSKFLFSLYWYHVSTTCLVSGLSVTRVVTPQFIVANGKIAGNSARLKTIPIKGHVFYFLFIACILHIYMLTSH